MRVLITGATGYIGTHLLVKLKEYTYKLVVRKFHNEYPKDSQVIYNKDKINIFKKEIEQYNPEIVIHLASFLTSLDDIHSIKKVIDSNITFTSILLESLKNTNVKLFINTGTFAEFYGNDEKLNPAYYYAASKIASRSIIKYFKNIIGFKTINIIPYTVYGGKSRNKKVIDYIINSIDSDSPVNMTSGKQILDFIHINDVVEFYIHCLKNMELLQDEEDYHIGTGVGTSIRELSFIIEKEYLKKTNIKWGSKEYRTLDIMKAIAPTIKLKEKLNWEAKISIVNGIRKILQEEK